MDQLDRQAYDLGWDHATFDLNVPGDASKSFCDGYRAFRHGNNKTTQKPDKFTRKWLQIRFGAITRGKQFSLDISPEYIEKITPASGKCPVTELPLTYGTGEPTDWSVDRANNDRGYVRGNILIMSQAANAAKGNKALDTIEVLAGHDESTEGMTPSQWGKMAQLIEPAFGADDEADVNPIQMLFGQPIALGMPVSPLAGFQVALSRAAVQYWDPEKMELMVNYLCVMEDFICRNRSQEKALGKLLSEVMRRSRHLRSYTEIWATRRVQRRLVKFLNTLDGAGIGRLVELQDLTVGSENTKIV
jgi:hypothetical protein